MVVCISTDNLSVKTPLLVGLTTKLEIKNVTVKTRLAVQNLF